MLILNFFDIICQNMVESPEGSLVENMAIQIGRSLEVVGPGVESLKKTQAKIVATTHLTDADLQYTTLALAEKLGGLNELAFAHSSSHRSSERPELKVLFSSLERFVGKERFFPVEHNFGRRKESKGGKTITYEDGRLNPDDWEGMVAALRNGRTLLTAAYFDIDNYFSLPERSGYLPLILKHKVPSSLLLPVAVLFPPVVYRKKIKFPVNKPRIIVCKPLDLTPLTWSSAGEQISKLFPDFQGEPIDFFEMILKRNREDKNKPTDNQKLAMRKQFKHISRQLKLQSKQLMSILEGEMPEGMTV